VPGQVKVYKTVHVKYLKLKLIIIIVMSFRRVTNLPDVILAQSDVRPLCI
jgi:hypothetical protein